MLLSLRPSFTLPPHVIKSILYVYLFIPTLQLGSSVPFFFFFICLLWWVFTLLLHQLCVSLSSYFAYLTVFGISFSQTAGL